MKKSGFTLIELLMASVVLAVLAAIAIPNFTRMQVRAEESEVKSVAHSVQIAVEDFKAVPGQEGMKPVNVAGFVTYLPTNVQSKKNPFSPTGATYGPPGNQIVDGAPSAEGEVGYINNGPFPYNVVAQGKNSPGATLILTLQEGE
jgi:prepilin-type N-terminal cleavage/methylation domain-containing protein